ARATTAGGALNVTARDFLFDPNKLSAKKGQTISINFKNDGSNTHTFTLYTDEDHTKPVANGNSDPVTAGGSKTLTVSLASDSGADLLRGQHRHQLQPSFCFFPLRAREPVDPRSYERSVDDRRTDAVHADVRLRLQVHERARQADDAVLRCAVHRIRLESEQP